MNLHIHYNHMQEDESIKKIISKGPQSSTIVDVADVLPGDDQILIKNRYVGVCMSEHDDWLVAEQGIGFGHEPMGIPGTEVCVVGAGYMGCGAISLLKLRGARVVAIDILPECLENAKKFGADEVWLAEDFLREYKVKPLMGTDRRFSTVMEWGETNESLDVAINVTDFCGQLCIGAYHTGGKRLVDVQQLNMKAIECLSTHPRERHLMVTGAQKAVELLTSGRWNYQNLPVKIYPMSQFDRAHQEIKSKYGHYMKALIDMTMENGEPYYR